MLCRTHQAIISVETFSIWQTKLFSKHLHRAFNIPNGHSDVARAKERALLKTFEKLQEITSQGYPPSSKISGLILTFSRISSGHDKTTPFLSTQNMLLFRKTLESKTVPVYPVAGSRIIRFAPTTGCVFTLYFCLRQFYYHFAVP